MSLVRDILLRFRLFKYVFTTAWDMMYGTNFRYFGNAAFFANEPKNWRLKFERKKCYRILLFLFVLIFNFGRTDLQHVKSYHNKDKYR
jgi:hypothetical protein